MRKNDNMYEKYYTLEEIAITLKTPIAYLRRMVREEKIITHKIERNYKVKESDVKRYVDSCRYKMTDKELFRAIGLDDRTITIGLNDEYAQMMLEKKIDDYLKKLDEEKKKNMIKRNKSGIN